MKKISIIIIVFLCLFIVGQSNQWVTINPGWKKVGSNVELTNSGDNVNISGNTTFTGTVTSGVDGTAQDFLWYSDTAGDNMLYDQSEEKLVITGTNAQNALEIADGNLSVADNATFALVNVLADTGTVDDNYGGTITPAPAALVENMVVYMRAGIANTGAATLAFNGLTVKNIKTNTAADPANNDILTASMAIFFYNGTNWVLLNPASTTD